MDSGMATVKESTILEQSELVLKSLYETQFILDSMVEQTPKTCEQSENEISPENVFDSILLILRKCLSKSDENITKISNQIKRKVM